MLENQKFSGGGDFSNGKIRNMTTKNIGKCFVFRKNFFNFALTNVQTKCLLSKIPF